MCVCVVLWVSHLQNQGGPRCSPSHGVSGEAAAGHRGAAAPGPGEDAGGARGADGGSQQPEAGAGPGQAPLSPLCQQERCSLPVGRSGGWGQSDDPLMSPCV